MVNPRGRMKTGAQWYLLVLCILWAFAGVRSAGPPASREASLREAEERLDDLRKQLADSEKIVESIQARTCSLKKDPEACREHRLKSARMKRQKMDDIRKEAMSDKPWERFRMEGQLRPPAGSKILFAKFLPITNVNNTKLMNRFLVAADTKGTIHIFNSDGQHLAEKSTGHSGSITALSVDFRPSINYHVVTGSSNGEVKIWSIAAPERPGGRGGARAPQNGTNSSSLPPSSPGKETGGRTSNGTATVGRSNVAAAAGGRGRMDMKVQWAQWQPAWKLEAEFSPSSVDAVRGISRRYHMVDMTQEGQRPITLIDFVPKGRNFNLLVADGIGRMSMHMKNGTLTSSVMLPGSGAPRCSSIFKTVAAICTGGGIALYEVKDRKLLTATCTRHVPTDDSLPEWKPTPANQGGNSSQHRKRTRFPPQPIVADFVSYAQDVTQEHIAYAGTADGRFMVLNVRQEKTRVRCTLSNEVRVSARADTQVHVASTKGYMYVASSSAKGSTTITAYNSTGMTRSFPPEIALQVVIRDSTGGKQGAIMYGDRHAGLVITVGGSAALISARLESPTSQDDWGSSSLAMLRHPMLLGMIGMVFYWQMKKKSAPAPGDSMEEALREDMLSKLGGAKDPFEQRFQRGAGSGLGGMMGGGGGMGGGGYGLGGRGYSGGRWGSGGKSEW